MVYFALQLKMTEGIPGGTAVICCVTTALLSCSCETRKEVFLNKLLMDFFCVFFFVCFLFVLLSFLQFTHTISTGDMQHFEHLEPLTC